MDTYIPVVKEIIELLLGPFGAFILLLIVFIALVAGVYLAAKYFKTVLDTMIREFTEVNANLFKTNERLSQDHKAEVERLITHHKEDQDRCERRYESMQSELNSTIRELFRKGK